jgi:L-iditol 2-dehydrogenase
LGAEAVMITDLSDHRLKVAEECGVDFTVNSSVGDLTKEVENAFGPEKADLILECAGSPVTISQAAHSARKGTDIIVVGVFEGQVAMELGLLQDWELRLIGTLMYQRDDFRSAVDLIKSGRILLDPLISRHFDFIEQNIIYKEIDAGIKVVKGSTICHTGGHG